VEVSIKFDVDWSSGSCVKEGHRYKQSVLYREIDDLFLISFYRWIKVQNFLGLFIWSDKLYCLNKIQQKTGALNETMHQVEKNLMWEGVLLFFVFIKTFLTFKPGFSYDCETFFICFLRSLLWWSFGHKI